MSIMLIIFVNIINFTNFNNKNKIFHFIKMQILLKIF